MDVSHEIQSRYKNESGWDLYAFFYYLKIEDKNIDIYYTIEQQYIINVTRTLFFTLFLNIIIYDDFSLDIIYY